MNADKLPVSRTETFCLPFRESAAAVRFSIGTVPESQSVISPEYPAVGSAVRAALQLGLNIDTTLSNSNTGTRSPLTD